MPTVIQRLKAAHDELAKMTIPAIESVHMGSALITIEQVIQELEKEEAKEDGGEK